MSNRTMIKTIVLGFVAASASISLWPSEAKAKKEVWNLCCDALTHRIALLEQFDNYTDCMNEKFSHNENEKHRAICKTYACDTR